MKDNQKEASLQDIIYFAGLIDGEGCFMMGRNRGLGQYYCKFTIGMVERHVIEELKATFKIENKINVYVSSVPNRQVVYKLSCTNAIKLKEIIYLLLPYLRIKNKQCEVILGYLNSRTVRDMTMKSIALSDSELQLREEFYHMIKKLNAVGAPATTNREDTGDGEVIV